MPLHAGPVPKYYQLTEILRNRILSGELKAGDQLPSEHDLCQAFHVSRGTVRKAINTLLHEGRVRSEQGLGTFVAESGSRPTFFMLTHFDEEMRAQQRLPTTRLLKLEVILASNEIGKRLELQPADPVIRIERIRMADNRPVIHEVRYLAQSLCPSLIHDDLERESIHELLIHKYQIPLIRTVHTVEARILTPEQAELLQVEPGSAGFFVDRLTYTLDEGQERPAVWYQALYQGKEYHFRVEFETRV